MVIFIAKQPKNDDLFFKSLPLLLESFLGSFLSHRLFKKLPKKLLRDYLENFLDLHLRSSIDDGLDNWSWIYYICDTYSIWTHSKKILKKNSIRMEEWRRTRLNPYQNASHISKSCPLQIHFHVNLTKTLLIARLGQPKKSKI